MLAVAVGLSAARLTTMEQIKASSAIWLFVLSLFPLIWNMTKHFHVECSTALLARITLVYLIVHALPFVPPVSGTGPSFTGMKLSNTDQPKINNHAMLYVGLLVLMLIQVWFWRNRTIHEKLIGRFFAFLYFPLVFPELAFNAGVVFLTSKVDLLAEALGFSVGTSTVQVTMMGRAASMSLFCSALAVPPLMLIYFGMSMFYLFRERDVRLHIAYIQLFVIETLSTGTVRYIIRGLFLSSKRCEPFRDEVATIQIQTSAALLSLLVGILLKCLVSATLAPSDKREKLRSLFYVDFTCASIQCLLAWKFGLPPIHDC